MTTLLKNTKHLYTMSPFPKRATVFLPRDAAIASAVLGVVILPICHMRAL